MKNYEINKKGREEAKKGMNIACSGENRRKRKNVGNNNY